MSAPITVLSSMATRAMLAALGRAFEGTALPAASGAERVASVQV
jgi:hypothetical protein